MHLDPSLLAIPIYIIFMLWEWWTIEKRKSRGGDYLGYERFDTMASIGTGLVSVVTVGLLSLLAGKIGRWAYDHRLLELSGWLAWFVGMVVWDFAYYWLHRAEHEIRLLWASHVGHHSSDYYNFSTALRQTWLPWGVLLFFPPIAFLGIEPWIIMTCGGINLLYQFFIHTETISRLPYWVEYIFNTPSHHRVHHGSNPQYLDKNHGGMLIIWDRMFGTFKEESLPVIYGLTKRFQSFNLWRIFIHEYEDIVVDVKAATGWRKKLRAIFGNPATATVRSSEETT